MTQPRRGFLARLFRPRRRAAPLAIPRWQETSDLFLPSTRLDTTPRETKESQLAAYAGYVYAAASTLSGDVRATPWAVWRVGDPDDDSTWERQAPPPQLARPNAMMTAGHMFELWSLHKDLTGTFHLHTVTEDDRPGGAPLGFEVVYPHWVDRAVQQEETGRLLGWFVQVPGRSGRVLSAIDVLFDPYPHPTDPLRGASPVEAFAISYDMDLYARAYGTGLMKNQAVPPMIVTSKSATLTPQQADDIREKWRERYSGRTDQIGVLPNGSTVQTLGLKMADAGFLQMAEMSKDQILQIYKVPPSKLGDVKDGVSRANAEALDHTYNANALWPRLERIQEAVNTHLMPRLYPGDQIGEAAGALVFRFASPIQADKAFRAANAHEAFRSGAIKIGGYLNELGIRPSGGDIDDLRAVPNTVTLKNDEDILAPTPTPPAPPAPAEGDSVSLSGQEGDGEAEERALRMALRGMFAGWQARSRETDYQERFIDHDELRSAGVSSLDPRIYPRPAERAVEWYERLKSSVARELAAGRKTS